MMVHFHFLRVRVKCEIVVLVDFEADVSALSVGVVVVDFHAEVIADCKNAGFVFVGVLGVVGLFAVVVVRLIGAGFVLAD